MFGEVGEYQVKEFLCLFLADCGDVYVVHNRVLW